MLSVLLAGAIAMLTSFTKEEPKSAAPTGGLSVKISLADGAKDVSDAPIGLAASQEQLDNMDYIATVFTNKEGIANFGQLAPGTYYIDGGQTIGDGDDEISYLGEGTAVVVAGKNIIVDLVLPVFDESLLFGDEEDEE